MVNEQQLVDLAALATPLPPVPESEVFTSEQWDILLSICEVLIPSLNQSTCSSSKYLEAHDKLHNVLPSGISSNVIPTFLSENVVTADFKEAIRRRFAACVPISQTKALAFVLNVLNTRAGSIIMTGSSTIIHQQPLHVRSEIICKWAISYLPPLRAVFGSLENLTKATWLAQSKTLFSILDYSAVPKNVERNTTYPYQFLTFEAGSADEVVELTADVVIVGSGCGAGVVAAELSESLANMNPKPRILVLEKGYNFSSQHFPMAQPSASMNLMEAGGGVIADDGQVAMLAGSTFGGGGTVNWSASLQIQHFVRDEWAMKHNLPYFKSQLFQQRLDEVCDKMGVVRMHDELGKHNIPHSFANRTLLEGARQLGLTAEVVPQNAAGKPHDCGRCNLGCPGAIKQGPANCWFPKAAKNGVEFIEGCFAQKILWDESSTSKDKRAIGVKAKWTSRSWKTARSLRIIAPRIIVSAGTLHSPLLLQRSGLTPTTHKHIGSNLHLHPTMCINGKFSERVNPWDGPILTTAITSLEDMDGAGHGPKIETMNGTPDSMPTWSPWRPRYTLDALKSASSPEEKQAAAMASALDWKTRVGSYAYSFGLIALQRDILPGASARGHVYRDPDHEDMVRVSYTTSPADMDCIVKGALTAARVLYVMGAQRIDIFAPAILPFERSESASDDVNEAAFKAWINEIKAMGAQRALAGATLGSAHQMGTCRMSASPNDGVVDARGKIWGTSNVYVADASVFPSASGVNPMVTTMTIALGIARGIAETMKNETVQS